MRLITDEQHAQIVEALEWGDNALIEGTPIQISNRTALAVLQALPEVEVVGKVETCATHYEAKRHSVLSFTDKPIPLDKPLYATKDKT